MTPFEKSKAEIAAALPAVFEDILKGMRFAPHYYTSEARPVGSIRLNGRDVQVQLKFQADPDEFIGADGKAEVVDEED